MTQTPTYTGGKEQLWRAKCCVENTETGLAPEDRWSSYLLRLGSLLISSRIIIVFISSLRCTKVQIYSSTDSPPCKFIILTNLSRIRLRKFSDFPVLRLLNSFHFFDVSTFHVHTKASSYFFSPVGRVDSGRETYGLFELVFIIERSPLACSVLRTYWGNFNAPSDFTTGGEERITERVSSKAARLDSFEIRLGDDGSHNHITFYVESMNNALLRYIWVHIMAVQDPDFHENLCEVDIIRESPHGQPCHYHSPCTLPVSTKDYRAAKSTRTFEMQSHSRETRIVVALSSLAKTSTHCGRIHLYTEISAC